MPLVQMSSSRVDTGVAYIDRLGYAFCSTCRVKIAEDPADNRKLDRQTGFIPSEGKCDYPGCGKPLSESAETVEGTAMIEIVACKIF